MLIELEKTRDAMSDLELKKNNQINEIKSGHQVEIQGIKRQINHVESSSDHEIRKYRDQLDKR